MALVIAVLERPLRGVDCRSGIAGLETSGATLHESTRRRRSASIQLDRNNSKVVGRGHPSRVIPILAWVDWDSFSQWRSCADETTAL